MQLLVDDCHPSIQRVGSVGEGDRTPLQLNFSLSRRIVAAEDFQQRGFPGAVFPHQRVDLSGLTVETDIIQRFDAREAFTDAFESQIGRDGSHNAFLNAMR
ncbi:hypothetical protein D3C78_1354260 [compost metagenome]